MAFAETYVSVVAPLHDDASHLEESVAGLFAVLAAHYSNYEVILVDDWSADGTPAAAERLLQRLPCLRLIRLARRFGTNVAIAAGLDAAIGDFVVVMDLRHDPVGVLPALVRLGQSGSNIVIGVCKRPAESRAGLRVLRALYFALCRRLFHFHVSPLATNFQLLSRQAVNAVTRIMQRNRHFRLVTSSVGYATTYFPYEQKPHDGGEARRTPGELLGEAVSLVVSHSTSPLRILSTFLAVAGLLNLVYVLYIVGVHFVKSQVAEGWTTLSLQISAMFFLLFVALAVLAEYVGKTLEESKGEPLYHVFDVKDSPQSVAHPERRNVLEEAGDDRTPWARSA